MDVKSSVCDSSVYFAVLLHLAKGVGWVVVVVVSLLSEYDSIPFTMCIEYYQCRGVL